MQRAREQGERKLMTIEDDIMHDNRRILLKRQNAELALMRLEEDVRANWEQYDFNQKEDKELAQAQDRAIQASYKMLNSRKSRKRVNILVDAQVVSIHPVFILSHHTLIIHPFNIPPFTLSYLFILSYHLKYNNPSPSPIFSVQTMAGPSE